MFENSPFPEWLEKTLVPDDITGSAYELVPADRRAWLKTGIARLHAIYGTPSEYWGRSEKHWRQGFVSVTERRPVDWTVLVVGQGYESGPRVLSAAMMPLLAGVENVLTVFLSSPTESADFPYDEDSGVSIDSGEDDPLGGFPVRKELLAAMELAGIEQMVVLDDDEAVHLLSGLEGLGRVLMLGDLPARVLYAATTRQHGMKPWREPDIRDIAVLDDAEEIDAELLQWAHPDWNIVTQQSQFAVVSEGEAKEFDSPDDDVASAAATPVSDFEHGLIDDPVTSDDDVDWLSQWLSQHNWAAVVCGAETVDSIPDTVPLTLGAGQEACWVWADLGTDFFMHTRASLMTDL